MRERENWAQQVIFVLCDGSIWTWMNYVIYDKRRPYFLHESKSVLKNAVAVWLRRPWSGRNGSHSDRKVCKSERDGKRHTFTKDAKNSVLGPVKSQRIKTWYDTNLTWQSLQSVIQSCTEADSVLPPCRLLLSVIWRDSVRHKAGNCVLSVSLVEGVQQRGSGVFILLRPWWRRLSYIKRIKKLSSHMLFGDHNMHGVINANKKKY